VVLAGEATVERTWNTRRPFEALAETVRLDRELSEAEAGDLLRRVQNAARP
jgi:hypothetical protein